jgi:hypothetical protein
MSAPSTGSVIEKPSYTHAALIDCIVANPSVSQRELAEHFGYTEGWMSQILRSDALRELLAARKAELFDPIALQGIEKRMEALAHQSMDVLADKLQLHQSADTALKVLEITSRSLGYGAKAPGVQINQQFVAYMPQKSASSGEWLEQHGAATRTLTIDTIIDGGDHV